MKALFIFGLLAGFAGVLAGAHFVPWVNPPRRASDTSVVANGGRAERFVIRLPADRIAAGGADAGLRVAAPGGFPLPSGLGTSPVLAEQFKLRDRAGNVIGIAARHWTAAPGGPVSAWVLLIPSRGALMLTAAGESALAVDKALAAAGRRDGHAWSGEVSVAAAGGDHAVVTGGSGEFADLTGHYTETWALTGAAATGDLRGTITIDTITYGGT